MKKLIIATIFIIGMITNFVSANHTEKESVNYTENETFVILSRRTLIVKNKVGQLNNIKVYKDQKEANKLLNIILKEQGVNGFSYLEKELLKDNDIYKLKTFQKHLNKNKKTITEYYNTLYSIRTKGLNALTKLVNTGKTPKNDFVRLAFDIKKAQKLEKALLQQNNIIIKK